MYDVDYVDDQHSHGKSVGKYHMVNRVNNSKLSFEILVDAAVLDCGKSNLSKRLDVYFTST